MDLEGKGRAAQNRIGDMGWLVAAPRRWSFILMCNHSGAEGWAWKSGVRSGALRTVSRKLFSGLCLLWREAYKRPLRSILP